MNECKPTLDSINAGALPALVYPPVLPANSVAIADKGTAIGKDCAGVDLAPVPIVGAVQTIPHPTGVQLVKICTPAGTLDRDYSTLCAPDGTKVLVVTAWDTTAPLATAPAVETYTLAGSVYTGDRALLTDCAAEKLDIVAEEYCSGGISYQRVSFYNVTTSPPTLAATLWRDASGASVVAPAVGKVGACITSVSVPNAVSSGTLTGGNFNVPVGAKSVTLMIHSSGGVSVTGEVTATFTWAGSSRTWDATATSGTDASYPNAFNFTALAATAVWEVNYQL
jgi:hypothetical protein